MIPMKQPTVLISLSFIAAIMLVVLGSIQTVSAQETAIISHEPAILPSPPQTDNPPEAEVVLDETTPLPTPIEIKPLARKPSSISSDSPTTKGGLGFATLGYYSGIYGFLNFRPFANQHGDIHTQFVYDFTGTNSEGTDLLISRVHMSATYRFFYLK